ncbi:hypothetical protein Bxe_C0719 [Paraburkholderia xenovorans LB400]|uniref:Uncharacterized protein n=1 Tax=Paraburkholderia xenovorans (strain LB400) TaxID=266265 RepID=Q13GY5_PARXL|nr:hypothetical protein Bxe_C0719 [Paraburkholderia xenovorans LB400]
MLTLEFLTSLHDKRLFVADYRPMGSTVVDPQGTANRPISGHSLCTVKCYEPKGYPTDVDRATLFGELAAPGEAPRVVVEVGQHVAVVLSECRSAAVPIRQPACA